MAEPRRQLPIQKALLVKGKLIFKLCVSAIELLDLVNRQDCQDSNTRLPQIRQSIIPSIGNCRVGYS
jgi:hypothetical protein